MEDSILVGACKILGPLCYNVKPSFATVTRSIWECKYSIYFSIKIKFHFNNVIICICALCKWYFCLPRAPLLRHPPRTVKSFIRCKAECQTKRYSVSQFGGPKASRLLLLLLLPISTLNETNLHNSPVHNTIETCMREEFCLDENGISSIVV